ncbi:MAG: sensor domain-containing diguanylate cyclase, partial [Actinomycetota bacterium]
EAIIEEKVEEAETEAAIVEPAKEEANEIAEETTEVATAEPTAPELPAAPDSLAQEIGIAVDRAGVDPETAASLREKITELSILHEASKALGASLILEEVIDTVVDISAKGLMADIGGALIFDGKTGLMTIASLRGFNAEEREVINSTTFAPGEGLLGEIFLKKQPVNINDLSEERPGATPFNGRIKSFAAVPLSTDGYDIGVIFLGKYAIEPFSKEAEEFLETLAGQAAIAVENAKLYAQAQEMAIHDGLTGIYNYRYFMKSLEEEIKRAERYGRTVSLMMIDIDLFKHVNDTYGHQRGDDVLKGLTQTLVNSTRETDIVSRYGGEEFCVILPETELDDAVEVAEKLRISVAKASYAREKGQSMKVTISLGVAAYPVLASNQEELLRKADDALYSAKTKRNMVVSATSGDRLAR